MSVSTLIYIYMYDIFVYVYKNFFFSIKMFVKKTKKRSSQCIYILHLYIVKINWRSTNGNHIYYGGNFIGIKKKKWKFFRKIVIPIAWLKLCIVYIKGIKGLFWPLYSTHNIYIYVDDEDERSRVQNARRRNRQIIIKTF